MKHHNTEWTEMSRNILVLAIIIQACAGPSVVTVKSHAAVDRYDI